MKSSSFLCRRPTVAGILAPSQKQLQQTCIYRHSQSNIKQFELLVFSASTLRNNVVCQAGGSALDKLGRVDGISLPIADMQRKKGKCYGCGASLQIKVPLGPGYVPADKYETKRKHRQLDKVLCERCAELCNGAMIPAVKDFTQKQQELLMLQKQTVQQQEESSAVQIELLGKSLISPEQLRLQLMEVKDKKAIVVMLIDLLDASGSLMTKVRDIVGKNPLILVGTKMDLLPEGYRPKDVAEWLTEAAARKHLNVVSCHLVSSKSGDGVSAATSKICRERKGRDVYVVGAANVGKSAFVRAMLQDMGKFESNNFDPAAMSNGRYLPVESAMPGTTLGIIPLQAFASGGTLYDTPGVHLHHRVPHMLSPSELKTLHPRRRLSPFVPPTPKELQDENMEETPQSSPSGSAAGSGVSDIPEPSQNKKWSSKGEKSMRTPGSKTAFPASCTYVWSGLVRLDVVAAPATTALAFYGPSCMQVYSMPLLKADQQFVLADDEDEEDGGSSSTSSTSNTTASKHNSSHGSVNMDKNISDLLKTKQSRELTCSKSVAARGGLVPHDLLIRTGEGGVGVGGKSGAIADIAVSGMPGWVTFWAPRAKHDLRVRVWVPVGVEVFLRPPFPCPSPIKSEREEQDVDGEMSEGQLLGIMDEYGGSLTPMNEARWWEAAVSQLEDVELGEDGAEGEDVEDEEEEGG
ncbi:hypothetical protein CEUSTIGMA_g12700.t1 [Chlamydomonas eustigma]|uniref:Uncharacterized protein n=1 Tax=Chlamydomonas eustigma TaxID=1157962 RepID=A0A250XQS4_9CHLO|nr:hypothetical protein CEUSTIGMA_g12700.t1 [Chlamydomonas eustigma]|eukprot:GAX85282.1 hypothetical protein CEUSTIGMA_g12700.t1 [Chlamydomonas eustigma]